MFISRNESLVTALVFLVVSVAGYVMTVTGHIARPGSETGSLKCARVKRGKVEE